MQEVKKKGIDLDTRLRKSMLKVVHSKFDQVMLRKRSLLETIFDELKNLYQIEHTGHPSLSNFAFNLMAGIAVCCLQPIKPSIKLRDCQKKPTMS